MTTASTVRLYALAALAPALMTMTGCRKPAEDWSAKELKPSEYTMGGVPFTATLPAAGMKADAAKTSEEMLAWEAEAGSFSGPQIMLSVTLTPPTSLEAAVKAASAGEKQPVARKEAINDGYIVTLTSPKKTSYTVDAWIPATDELTFKCSISQMDATDTEIPNYDATRAWAEKICLSVKPKTPVVKVEVIPEMKDFLASSFGSSAKVTEGLKKYGAEGLETNDMDVYDLEKPSIVKSRKNGSMSCYKIDAKAGITTRSYDLCWEGSKIKQIKDLGMR